jgi:3-isopropylmalate dehydrogenase
MKKVAVVAGDGVGKEVIREAVLTLEQIKGPLNLQIELKHFDWGADRYLKDGVSLPSDALSLLSTEYSAILAGAFGDPRIPSNKHAEEILLGLRRGLDLYINLRPVRLIDNRLSPLRGRNEKEIDFVVFRENTEGAYCGAGGAFKKGTNEEIATQEEINTRKGVERIIRAAFDYARANNRSHVTMGDKSNVQQYAGGLWQRVFREVSANYPEIKATHQYVDAMAMFMVLDPGQYEVIVTNNLFGDILTDIGAAIQGGLGVAASGNIHPGRVSLFEPVHGSAPQMAGKNLANPIGAVLSTAMMLKYLQYEDAADLVEQAVKRSVTNDETTPDLGGKLSTELAGAAIRKYLPR